MGRSRTTSWVFLVLLCAAFPGCNRKEHQGSALEASSTPIGRATRNIETASEEPEAASALVSLPSAVHDWPSLFGPHHNSTSQDEGLLLDWSDAGPPCKWRVEVGAGYSSPVVSQNRLVVSHRQGDEELVDCLEADTGARLWRFASPIQYQCPFKYSSGPYSTPVIDGDWVYSCGAEGKLHGLNLQSGELLWSRDLNQDYQVELDTFPVAASPLVERDLLILVVGGKSPQSGIVALDKRTGQTVWTATQDRSGYATPVAATIRGRRQLLVFTADGLVVLDPQDGAVRSSMPFRAKNQDLGKRNASSPVVSGDLVTVAAYASGCLCVRVLDDGRFEEVWRGGPRMLDSQYTNLSSFGGLVYGYTSFQRSFRALDQQTGEVVWSWPSDLGRGAMFIAVKQQFIMLGELGHLAVLDTKDRQCKLRSMTKEPLIESPCYSAPALAQGLLYLRNEREVACFDLRESSHHNTIAQDVRQQ